MISKSETPQRTENLFFYVGPNKREPVNKIELTLNLQAL